MGTLVRSDMGKEDIKFHVTATPNGSATRQTYQRTTDDPLNPLKTMTAIAAEDVPLLDDKIYSAAPKSPYATLVGGRNVGNALRDAAKYGGGAINLERICKYGSVSQADATANAAAIAAALAEIKLNGQGAILQPPGLLQVHPALSGDPMVLADTMPAFSWVGVPGASLLRAYDGNQTGPLLKILKTTGVTVDGVIFDKVGIAGGECLLLEGSSGIPIASISIFRVATNRGQHGIKVDGASGHASKITIDTSEFLQSNAAGAYLLDISSSHVQKCYFESLSGAGGILADTGATVGNVLADVDFSDNILGGATAQLFIVSRDLACTYDAAKHRGIKLIRNSVTKGDVNLQNVDQSEMSYNRLYAGGFGVLLSDAAMVSSSAFRADGNESFFASGIGFGLVAAIPLSDFRIRGGTIYKAQLEGMQFNPTSGAKLSLGRVSDVLIQDCSQFGSGVKSGMQILPGSATSGVIESLFTGNIIRSTAATKHKIGFDSVSGGATANVKLDGTMIGGYVSGRVALNGCAEVNAYDLGA